MFAIKTLNKKFFLLSIFIFLQNLGFVSAETLINKSEKEIVTTVDLPNEIIKSQYLVDTGDSLYINFRNIAILSGSYNVDSNGQILLPELGLYFVRGKTIEEIKYEITEKYNEVLINPNIEIIISNHRTLNVYINGEVNRPGLYQLDYTKNYKENTPKNIVDFNSLNITQADLSTSSVPRLFDALQLVEGLTNKADLSEIKIVRNNSKTLGGGKIQAEVNMLNLLKNGDQSQNIKLFDGDYIFIPASENILLDQLIEVNKTNLNPREIEVFISGNVTRPGRIVLRQNTSLVKAIMTAGGKSNSTGNVEFVRLRRDGKSDRRVFKLNDSAIKGSYSNPILISGDIVVVNKNLLGKATTVISEIGTPVINAYGVYKIFD